VRQEQKKEYGGTHKRNNLTPVGGKEGINQWKGSQDLRNGGWDTQRQFAGTQRANTGKGHRGSS